MHDDCVPRLRRWAAVLACGAICLGGCTGGANGAGSGSGGGTGAGGGSGGGTGAPSGSTTGIAGGGASGFGSGVGVGPSDDADIDATLDSGGAGASNDASPDSTTADSASANVQDGSSSGFNSGDLWRPPAGRCPSACGPGQKFCNLQCVNIDDPKYGCGATTCDSCLLASGRQLIPPAVTSVQCVAGACAVGSCAPGSADCNGNFGDGCESSLDSPGTCGSCKNACPAGQTCHNETCVDAPSAPEAGADGGCPFPRTDCGGLCRDLTSDPLACGSCGNNCGDAPCEQGQCQVASPPPPQCDAGTVNVCHVATGNQTVCADTWWLDDPSTSCMVDCTAGCPTGSVCAWTAADFYLGTCELQCPAGTYGAMSSNWTACQQSTQACPPGSCSTCPTDCGSDICVEGSCTTLSTIQFVTGLTKPYSIAVDGTNLYVTDYGTNDIWQVSKASGAKTLLASGQAGPTGLAVDAQYVYWGSNLGGAILRATIGVPQSFSVLYSSSHPSQLSVDDTQIYWVDDGGLHSSAKGGGGTPATLSDPSYPGFIPTLGASDATHFYGPLSHPVGMGMHTAFFASFEKATGAVGSIFATGSSNPGDILYGAAANDAYVYFAEAAPGSSPGFPNPFVNTLWQVTKASNCIYDTNSASCAASSYGLPMTSISSMTADSCSVYWTSGSAVYRLTPGATPVLPLTTDAVAPGQIVVDDSSAYWVDQTWIGRVPK